MFFHNYSTPHTDTVFNNNYATYVDKLATRINWPQIRNRQTQTKQRKTETYHNTMTLISITVSANGRPEPIVFQKKHRDTPVSTKTSNEPQLLPRCYCSWYVYNSTCPDIGVAATAPPRCPWLDVLPPSPVSTRLGASLGT